MTQQLHSWLYLWKKKKTQKDTGTPTFIAALFIIPKIWKKQVTINRWINKDLVCVCVYIYVMEYYSDIKKKNFPFAATWMDLENITLSEINQTERDKYCMTSLICRIYKIQQTTANTVHIRKKKQTYRHREQTSRQCRGEGMGQTIGYNYKNYQGCILPPREYSQYVVITVNGK